MKVVINGNPGIGKTALVKKLAGHIKADKVGFYSEEIIKKGTRMALRLFLWMVGERRFWPI